MAEHIFDFEKERKVREELKFTRENVAEKLNFNVHNLYRLEKNHNGTDDLDLVNGIAEMYNCFLDDFLKDGYVLQ